MELNHLRVALLVAAVGFGVDAHPHNISCQPQNPHQPRNVLEATDWLSRFGYISTFKSWSQGVNEIQALDEAITAFQILARIKVTGKLDELTLQWMGKDRCGVPDVIRRRGVGRHRRNTGALKWKKYDLTYFVTQYTPDLSRDHVDRTLAEAFKIWADVTPLTFTRVAVKDNVDIEIKFVHGVHGDNNPFDGEGGVLAHAFFPPSYPGNVIGGDTHFDEAERWTIELDDEAPGRRLFCVALHEFGHALGLDHSDQQGSVMWPWSQACGNGTLDQSDIRNIQRLYGVTRPVTTTKTTTRFPTTTPTTPPRTTKRRIKPTIKPRPTRRQRRTRPTRRPTPPTKRPTPPKKRTRPPVRPTRCTACTRTPAPTTPTTIPTTTSHQNPVCRGDGKLDAVDLAPDGNVYGFKGLQIFRFSEERIHSDYPKRIDDVFHPGPNAVDAAVSFYYKTRWTRRIKHITYLFRDNLVWRYEYKRRNLLKLWEPKVFNIVRGYPKTIEEEFGIRTKFVDAAFRLKKKKTFYITRGDYVWEIHIHKTGFKTKGPHRLSKDPALSYLPPLDSAAVFNKGGFFFFSGDYYHQLLPVDRKRARWLWPRYTLNAWFHCNFDNAVVPFNVQAKPKHAFASEVDF